MDSGNYKNINLSGHGFNWEHLVFISKCRYKVFRHEYTREVIKKAIYEIACANRIEIREFAFGEDLAHVHLEVDVPNTITVSKVIQILKSYSAYVLFLKIPNFRKLYPRGSFWSGYYSNCSVGPQDAETVKNYIRNQDISRGQMTLAT
jgi:putative transposase